MSIEELLKPRYLVIAEDTSKKFYLGDILIKEQERGQFILRHANRDVAYMITEENIVKFPHLFKKLEWHEERKESEMPEYVKNKSGRIFKVADKSQNNRIWHVDGEIEERFIRDSYYQPATEEEYIQQNKK